MLDMKPWRKAFCEISKTFGELARRRRGSKSLAALYFCLAQFGVDEVAHVQTEIVRVSRRRVVHDLHELADLLAQIVIGRWCYGKSESEVGARGLRVMQVMHEVLDLIVLRRWVL